jgi:predicted metal-dependent hydrolase
VTYIEQGKRYSLSVGPVRGLAIINAQDETVAYMAEHIARGEDRDVALKTMLSLWLWFCEER